MGGAPLRHFTPFYTPMSSGINVFAQVISRDENAYVFPPFVMMGPLLKFLLQARIPVTIIAPQLSPTPYWWPGDLITPPQGKSDASLKISRTMCRSLGQGRVPSQESRKRQCSISSRRRECIFTGCADFL